MADHSSSSTSPTLLGRLRDARRDEAAWADFVSGYAPSIARWCRVWGLQPADVEDVTQVVLLKLSRTMANFRYDPTKSFRAYLKTLTKFAVRDALDEIRARGAATLGPEMAAWLAVEDTGQDLARWVEAEVRADLFREASARVSARVDPKTWEAFVLLSTEKRPGKEVAERLGMTVSAAYMAKSRVLQMMRSEVRTLSRDLMDPS